jgi:alpha-L-rhamnosidase
MAKIAIQNSLQNRALVALFCFFTLIACNSQYAESVSSTEQLAAPIALKVGEGFRNPIGYYESKPRFSWKLAQNDVLAPNVRSEQSNVQQSYQIQVANQFPLSEQSKLLWDTGKVESTENAWVKYAGLPLNSRQQVKWRVRYWNNNERLSAWSEIQSIELGLLNNEAWQAQWIGHPETLVSANPSQATLATPQYLRRVFTLSKPIKSARLYITAKGLFKAFLNGKEVAPNDAMTPGWTPYDKRIETLTYDVTSMLASGENVIASSLAGGWYAGRVFKFTEREHKVPAKLLAQLEITYEDGSKKIIASDNEWKASLQGPIRFASIYDGERYEQSKELGRWNESAKIKEPSAWLPVTTESIDQNVALSPKRHAPIRHTDTLSPISIVSNEKLHEQGVVIYDFGQNMVGVPQIELPVIKGQEVTLRFAEALHKGEFYTDNYRSAQSTNVYVPAKTELIRYQPTYTYHGYRYLEISGFDSSKEPNLSWARALVHHSDVSLHASFNSSHSKLNKLSDNILWGLRSNFYDIPLDCPQRDERLGWTGDAQVFATPSMYLADVYGFWSAWLQSVREDQKEDGLVPLYVPFVEWINWASSGWGDAVTIIPWDLYMLTGDVQILQDNYDMMKKWLDYHSSQSSGHISSMKTFGDWLQPFPDTSEGNGNRGDTDFQLISTAYYARSVELTMKSALALGKKADAGQFKLLHDQIKTSFRQTFFDQALNPKKGRATQTSYLLGLHFGLFSKSELATARQKLIEQVNQANNHLQTGFLGTPLLLAELQKAGRVDLAYDILFNETYPSWFYSVNNGATTTWERWNSYSLEDGFNPQGMNSLNHYAYGSVYRWFYEGILGINAATPGFKKILIAPQIGEKLSHASGDYQTPQGEISVEWRKENKQLSLNIVVPPNSTADVVIPQGFVNQSGASLSNLSSGNYQFSFLEKV